jgi:hypothetical protein
LAKGGVLTGIAAASQHAASANNTVNYGNQAVSPLVAQYGQWSLGRPYANVALPRDPLDFLTGAFGPLTPIQPVGIDQPNEGDERPEPRRWQYPVGWNMPIGTPGAEGLKLADFATLRLYAEMYSVARACIQLRKDEILGIGWDVQMTADAGKAARGDAAAMKDFGNRRGEMLKFFRRPDPNYNDFGSWFEAALEDVFVIDALSIYLHPSKMPGKGLMGTSLAGLDLIAGDTIRPLLDLRGGSPSPPSPAYQQYMYGVPRVDLLTMMSGDDIKNLDEPVKTYRGDQLMYLPRNPRSWTPYGQAPMERCVIPVITGLRKQQYAMDFYLEGTIPGMFISPGEAQDLSPNQIRELQDSLNAIAGDQAWKHKIIVLPSGSTIDPQKPPVLADAADEIIISQVCMAYGVMPMELGVSPRVSATQTSGAANQMAKASQDIQKRKALKPDLLWLKTALFDRIIQGICGQDDMEWTWDGLEEGEDEASQTSNLVQQISFGLTSIDEARNELGKQPWGLPITSDPGWATQTGFIPLGTVTAGGQAEPGVTTPLPPGMGPPPAPGGTSPNTPDPTPATATAAAGEAATASTQRKPQRAIASGNSGQSPGHDSAEASYNSNKAALAELDSLRRHLNKGRHITTWVPRYINPGTLMGMAEDLNKGLSPDEVVKVAMGISTLSAQIESEFTPKHAIGPAVKDQLTEDYPESSLDWIKDASWTGPKEIPLDTVDTTHKKSWRAFREPDRVAKFARKMKKRAARGEHLKPVVLVDTPDTAPGTNLKVIDGHHRTLASVKNDMPVWGYVGKVKSVKGPWDTLHNQQFPEDERHPTDEFANDKRAS